MTKSLSRRDVPNIRVMLAQEFDAVRAVQVAAFDDDSIGSLLDELRASWCWVDELSFVAELNGEIVGHVLYTKAIVDAPDALLDVLVLSPVGVRPDLHHQGVGTAMITHSLATLASRPEPIVFLEGNPVYYSRFGFKAAGELGFIKPSARIPDVAFQVYELAPVTAAMTGQLVYPDAFWRTDSVGLR